MRQCRCNVLFMWKSISRKKYNSFLWEISQPRSQGFSLFLPLPPSREKPWERGWKFPFLVLARNTIMLPHLIIHSPLHYLSTGRLREVKNIGRFKSFKRGGGRLQEVPNIVIWLANFWYFGKLVTDERWSLTRGGRNRRFDCSINVLLLICFFKVS